MSDLEQLKAELTEALHQPCLDRWKDCVRQVTTFHGPDVHAETAERLIPIVAAVLESERLRGVREGRKDAALAVRIMADHWRAGYTAPGGPVQEAWDLADRFACGARVDQPAGEQEAPSCDHCGEPGKERLGGATCDPCWAGFLAWSAAKSASVPAIEEGAT